MLVLSPTAECFPLSQNKFLKLYKNCFVGLRDSNMGQSDALKMKNVFAVIFMSRNII